jgi:FkbM family methyltransferase
MSWRYFLYRRLAPWVSFEPRLWDEKRLSLRSKHEADSFSDVFCDPFYWRAFDLVEPAPNLVVDCGANCGHFTLLVEKCVRARQGDSQTKYLLIEPNPLLANTLTRNLSDAGISARCVVKRNLLGQRTGTGTLWVHDRNFLAAGLTRTPGARPFPIEYLDLSKEIGEQQVDLMKIDIEGGEFDLVRSSLELFTRVRTLFMELHDADGALHLELLTSLSRAGLRPALPLRKAHGHQLAIFQSRDVPKPAGAEQGIEP